MKATMTLLAFLPHLIAALQREEPELGESLKSLLGVPNLPSVETLMTTLVNDLSALLESYYPTSAPDRSFIHVLDDYHKVHSPTIHKAISFLLSHQPPSFRLVLLTREDPPLALPSMMVRGEMTEIRAEDLRFTVDESMQFLDQVMGLNLERKWVEALDARTEGWIAGLQLAALSLNRRENIIAFFEDFHGSHRFVLDYLVDEILHAQTSEICTFLRQTSILDRFNASLCEAITGRGDSQEILAQLEQSNLFLIPLDQRREWYRYHHLFADFLRISLDGPLQNELHQRASAWFEANGYIPEAIQHALAAEAFQSAAQLIVGAGQDVFGRGETTSLLG